MDTPIKQQRKQKEQHQKLTLQQLQDVRDRLKQPLAAQTVLLPFGSKAFFSGRLSPASHRILTTADAVDGEAGPGGATTVQQQQQDDQECVIVRLSDGSKKEMTRREALDYLQTEIDECKMVESAAVRARNAKKAQAAKSQSTTTAVDALGARNNSTKRTAKTPLKNTPNQETNGSSVPQFLPYIEIREEIDGAGVPVRSETIDVTEQLQYLKTKGGEDTDGPLKSEHSPDLKQSTPRGDEDEVMNEVLAAAEPTARLKSLSDSEYDMLSSRLDELAILEEQAESQKDANLKSSTTLQSQGWSKGFLNKKPNKSKAKVNVKPGTSAPAMSDSARTKLNPPEDAPARASTRKTVAFGGTEIKEIPRVGERSVRDTIQRPPSRPLEASVFSGVVQEMHSALASPSNVGALPPKKGASRFAQQMRDSGGSTSAPPEQNQPQSMKKISRFAQERQQGLR